ncbi:MAG: hypothetical protein HC880_01825 [Bacteroidia bacterium]|nr:hypothetical protein [Bacteroidia bacterium]
MVTVDCDYILRKLVPKMEAAPEEEKLALITDILGRMVQQKCTDDPKFLELSERLAETEPTFGRYQFLVKAYVARDNLSRAMEYLEKSIPLAENNQEKAEAVMTRANFKRKQGNLGGARSDYMQAAQMDPNLAYEAYTYIGDMYMSSYQSCKGSDPSNPIHQRAVFIAAYNMYQRAGNQQGMAKAQAQFPSKTDDLYL